MEKTQCRHCGSEFCCLKKANRERIYCSDRCRWNASAKRNKSTKDIYKQCTSCSAKFKKDGKWGKCQECRAKFQAGRHGKFKHCLSCSVEFTAKNTRQKYCGKDCANVAKSAARVHKTRGELLACQQCNKAYKRKASRSGSEGKKFCSRDCSFRYRAARRSAKDSVIAHIAYRLMCQCCSRLGWYNKPTGFVCQGCRLSPACTEQRECSICKTQYCKLPHTMGRMGFCSDECRAEAKRRSKRMYPRTHKERADRFGVRYVPFDPIDVLMRDAWRCKACGIKTPKELRGTYEPNAPELDHILPMSLGGEHSKENTQCLCRSCNAAKSNARIDGDQMLLVG